MHSVLSAALEAMRDVDSFHFMEGFSKNSGVFGTLSGTDYDVTFEATGEYKSPDRLHRRAVIHGVDYPTESNLQTISIGYTRYVTDPDTGEWGRPADSFRDQDLFGNPIEVFEGVVALLGLGAYRGIVESGGVRVHRFSYRTPDLYLSGPKVHAFDAEILVGVDDLLVRELRTESKWRQRPCKPDQKCLAIEIVPGWRRLTVQFSYPDEGVTIEAPQIQSP